MNYSVLEREEKWNVITHGIGILLSISALVLLTIWGAKSEHSLSLFSGLFFGLSLIVLYTASTVYHLATTEKKKNKLRIFDHISIYYLIAGTYTPFALIALRDSLGWWIFGTVWTMAIIGTVFKLFFTGKYEFVSIIAYVLMGWLIVIDFSFLVEQLNFLSLLFLILGGGIYTLGTVFYAIHKIPYNHAIWHLFVLGGSIFHFFSVIFMI